MKIIILLLAIIAVIAAVPNSQDEDYPYHEHEEEFLQSLERRRTDRPGRRHNYRPLGGKPRRLIPFRSHPLSSRPSHTRDPEKELTAMESALDSDILDPCCDPRPDTPSSAPKM